MREFSFGNAMLHFARTDGPPGFVWKFVLSYGFGLILFFVAYAMVFGGTAFALMSAQGDPEVAVSALEGNIGIIALAYVLILPLMLLFYAVFEAAFQRRYLRSDGFKLRLGGDEWRLFVVYLIWFAFYILLYVFAIALVAGFGGGLAGVNENPAGIGIGLTLAVLVAMGAWIYFAVRFSPAAALTIRDRAIRFQSAWRVTRGRFWTMLGVYLLMLVAAMVVYLIVLAVFGLVFAGMMAAAGGGDDPSVAFGAFSNPATLISVGLIYLLGFFATGWFMFVWGGPAALAARTDPDHAGMDDPAGAFR